MLVIVGGGFWNDVQELWDVVPAATSNVMMANVHNEDLRNSLESRYVLEQQWMSALAQSLVKVYASVQRGAPEQPFGTCRIYMR
jgi:hypothetical protein